MSRHGAPWPRLTLPDRTLIDGSVEITYLTATKLEAEVVGRSGLRRYVLHDGTGWKCSCPSWRYRATCAHVTAVSVVAAPPGLRNLRPVPDPPRLLEEAAP